MQAGTCRDRCLWDGQGEMPGGHGHRASVAVTGRMGQSSPEEGRWDRAFGLRGHQQSKQKVLQLVPGGWGLNEEQGPQGRALLFSLFWPPDAWRLQTSSTFTTEAWDGVKVAQGLPRLLSGALASDAHLAGRGCPSQQGQAQPAGTRSSQWDVLILQPIDLDQGCWQRGAGWRQQK